VDRSRPESPLPEVSYLEADVTSPEDLARAFAVARDGLDICVANAGVFTEGASFVDSDPDVWAKVINVNLLAVLATLHHAARIMVSQGRGGRLIVTSSTAGLRGEARMPAYSASKAGVIAVVQALAAELAADRITVNAVAPGPIDTPMHRRAASAGSCGGILGQPDAVAAAIAFLASPESGHITGQTLVVDGGELLGVGTIAAAQCDEPARASDSGTHARPCGSSSASSERDDGSAMAPSRI
jgi:NAD(P)-dependent dehydrogenase (short-subunit alcohol dehydrogenase family)